MTSASQPVAHCPHCGAEVQTPGVLCWLCRHRAISANPNPYAPPRPLAGENASAQCSLASLFLVTTLVAVGLGLFLPAPGLGVLFAFVAAPALIRTFIAAGRRRQAGAPLSLREKIGTFFISWFIMGAIGLASFVAFMVVCVGSAFVMETAGINLLSEEGLLLLLVVGVIPGLIAAIPLAVWLLRRTRPAKTALPKSNG